MILDKKFSKKHVHKIIQVPRLSKQTDIILIRCKPLFEKRKSSDFPYPLEDLSYYALNPFTLILIIDNCRTKDHPIQSKLAKYFKDVLYIPATKILVSFSSRKKPWKFTAEIVCKTKAYCNSYISRYQLEDLIPGVMSPLEFHKFKFRVGCEVTVSMSVGTKNHQVRSELSEGQRFCDGGRKTSYFHYECDGNIMTLIEIARIHNFTIKPTAKKTSIRRQYITARDINFDYNYIRLSKRNGFHFHSFQTHTMLYCYTRNETTRMENLWTNVLGRNRLSCFGIIAFLVNVFILFSEDKIQSGLREITRVFLRGCPVALGQRPFGKRRMRITVTVLLLGMTMFANYWGWKAIIVFEKQMSSRVENKPTEYFKTLKDLVQNGYRIKADKKQQSDLFEEDFFKVGIKNVSKVDWHQSFTAGEYHVVREEIVKGKKYAMSVETMYMQDEIAVLSREARKVNRGVKCEGLPQKVALQLYLWELYTVNRYWVMETIHYLQGSGLLNYWNNNAKEALGKAKNNFDT
ncbi:unnamed protein product [Orchesella dallaii]|uniref:Uncharacterized protein n=1 Tax=Orchesella dallaii TaxID=48710 RepID=A0ABP1RB65_9HEXA